MTPDSYCALVATCKNPECLKEFFKKSLNHTICSDKCRERVYWVKRRDDVKKDGTSYKTKKYSPVDHTNTDQVCSQCQLIFRAERLRGECSKECRAVKVKTNKILLSPRCSIKISVRLSGIKAGASNRSIPFNLTKIPVCPPQCPVTGKEFYSDGRTTWASLDRIDNTRGYEDGNVWWISYEANRAKSNSSLLMLKNLVKALERL